MNLRTSATSILAALTLLALWLWFAAPDQVLGIDSVWVGSALLLGIAWVALFRLSRLPQDELGKVISPGEWQAWISTGFMLLLSGYLLLKSSLFAGDSLLHNPHTAAVGRNVVLLIVAWMVISQILRSHWQGQVQEDERDREISRVASRWHSYALSFFIIGLAVTLGLSPIEQLAWAKPLMIAHLLIFALLCAGLVESVATAIQYWRDRR